MTAATAAQAKPPVTPANARPRVPFWDNARFGTIALVVMGHAIQRQTSDSDNALTLYLFIYAFHIPAFAIISGFFTKATPPGTKQMVKVVTDLVIPYIIFQSIWTLVQWLVEGQRSLDFAQPHWTLWFFLALATFRVAMPYLALLRWPLLWALLLSIAVGYSPGVDSTFSLARTVGILPFFVLGWQLRQWKFAEGWMRLRWQVWPARALALGALFAWLGTIVVLITPFRDLSVHWFFYDDSYTGLGAQAWWAGFVRLGLIALAVALCAAFFVLIPRRETIFTAFGQATLYVYLLHSFVLYPIRESGVLTDDHASAVWLLTMVFASVAIAIALSSPIVKRLFRPLVEPKPRWLFSREVNRETAAREERRQVRKPQSQTPR